MEMRGRALFLEDGPAGTSLTVVADLPGLDESKANFSGMTERSVANVKRLVESDT